MILVVTLSLATWYVWHNAEDLLTGLLSDSLASYGFTLRQLEFKPSREQGFYLSMVELQSPTLSIQIEDLVLRPYASLSYTLHADSLKVIITAARDTEADTQDEVISLLQIQQVLSAYATFLPHRGDIRTIEFCAEICQTGTSSWFSTESKLFFYAALPAIAVSTEAQLGTQLGTQLETQLEVLLEVQLSAEQAQVSVIGSGPHRLYSDTTVHLGDQLLTANGTLHLQAGNLVHIGEGFSANVQAITGTGTYQLTLPESVVPRQFPGVLEGEVTLSADAAGVLETRGIQIVIEDTLSVTADFADSAQTITLDQPLLLGLSDGTFSASVAVEAGAHCTLMMVMTDSRCHMSGITATSKLPDYDLDTMVSLTGADLRFDPASGNPVIRSQLQLNAHDTTGPVFQATGNVNFIDDQLATNFDSAAIFGTHGFSVNLQHRLQNAEGKLLVQQEGHIHTLQPLLDRFLPTSVALHDGTWNASLEASWLSQHETSLSASVKMNSLQFEADGYALAGGNMNIALHGWPDLTTRSSASLSFNTIDVGFPIEDVAMTFDLSINSTTGQVDLTGQQLSLQLFDGTAVSDDFAWDSLSERGHVTLGLEQLSLSEILSLEDEKLYSTGRLNGSVPIHISEGNVSIASGIVSAIDPGGFIRYEPNAAIQATMQDNAQMTLLVEALSDFNYHELNSDLNYGEDGVMHAVVMLKGSNPSFQDGREVHFNLTLEENVATLLQSLRLGDDIAEQLDNRGNH